MNKMKNHCYGICFFISIAINILLCTGIYMYIGGARWGDMKQEISWQSSLALTWTEKAAAEAEVVAAASCSGHGRAFVDRLTSDGQPVCECFNCYNGSDCSAYNPECAAVATSGDLTFLEPFWIQNAANTAVVISGWHRMTYNYAHGTKMLTELENCIRKLHSIAGNAVTEGRYMVFGVGSAQLLSAAVYALSSGNSSSPSNVLASIPFYWLFKDQTSFFSSKYFEFEGNTNSLQSKNSTNNRDVIEFVTSPNNPDGELKTPVFGGKAIYDQVFYWPHFTPIPEPSDQDIMIFSLSKLTGHAGSRFGWAIIKDRDIYDKMLLYISMSDVGISHDTQLRALKILETTIDEDGKPFFEFAYTKMTERWDRLTSAFSKSTRFSLQDRHPFHCTYFNETRLPTPAFAWVKCEREVDNDCRAVLEAGKITSLSGSRLSATDRYTRVSLTMREDDFELLMIRFTNLISLENGSLQTM
ncbi:putative alliinase, EGF-like domain, pyridoxal phosphate-dependent transferase, major [Helianthus annuus]|nr:putative alliinase, EGF-like domain, pyridoxal phosphate-dependent transferase, major [Helianthus annuus]